MITLVMFKPLTVKRKARIFTGLLKTT